MSNYTKATNFTAKDGLPTGNSGKIVKGAEIDTELTAVASAISSKADLNSPALTGTPTAPTASYGTNTTQVATTAFVQAAIPSGVILLWSGSVASIPSGWALCNGSSGTPDLRNRFVVGAGSTYSVGDTGGSATSTLTSSELPAHTHSLSASGTTSGQSAGHTHTFSGTTGNQSADHTHSGTTSTASLTGSLGQQGDRAGIATTSGVFSGSGSTSFADFTNQGSVPQTINFDASHNHTITTGGVSADHTHTYSGTTSAVSGNHTHTVTVTGTSGSTGSGAAFTNLPPYYALAYIMRL
jgi:microcystin-dependent protein